VTTSVGGRQLPAGLTTHDRRGRPHLAGRARASAPL